MQLVLSASEFCPVHDAGLSTKGMNSNCSVCCIDLGLLLSLRNAFVCFINANHISAADRRAPSLFCVLVSAVPSLRDQILAALRGVGRNICWQH